MKNSKPDKITGPAEKKPLDKKTRNIILIIVGVVLLVALTITAILVINHVKAVRYEKEMRERPIKIAFYNVDTKTQEAIKKVLTAEWEAAAPEFACEFAVLDSSKPAEESLFDDFTIGILISDSGTAENISNYAVKPASDVYSGMPIAVRGISNTSIPLLIDDFEALYNIKLLNANGASPTPSMSDMLKFAKDAAGNRRFTLGCAGKDDKTLGMLISACMESMHSETSLDKLKKAVQNAEKASDTSQIFDTVLEAAGNEAFKSTLDTLCQWRKTGLFHSDWYSMTQQEVEYLMETDIFSVVFMPLSAHRTVPYRTIEKYTESFFPEGRVENANVGRSLVFSIITGTVIKNRYEEKSAISMDMLKTLLTLENQAKIADSTGLAPVSSTAESPDRQASNARLWAAASEKPRENLYDIFANPTAKTSFFNALRDYLKVN
jgi:hypothetical protein